jgi:hypothetical protein
MVTFAPASHDQVVYTAGEACALAIGRAKVIDERDFGEFFGARPSVCGKIAAFSVCTSERLERQLHSPRRAARKGKFPTRTKPRAGRQT